MRVLNSFIIIFILFFVFTSDVWACRCVPSPFKYRWQNADSVFTGEIKNIDILYKYAWSSYDDKPVKITFNVAEFFKDNNNLKIQEDINNNNKNQAITQENQQFVLHTSLQKLTCMGYPFKERGLYLVYAYKRLAAASEPWSLYNFPSDTYGVGGLCGGTVPYSQAKEEIQKIKAQIEKKKIILIKKAKKKK